MADVITTNGATASLEATSHIPIAQLTPLLTAPSSRSLKATVTLTWPYSSASGSVAFLLAEPDFRLRRTRGQVRVQFSGSSAKAIAKSGIASGDEVTLCLDGVEWLKEDSSTGTPGRGVDCELKFKERLLLQFRREDSQQVSLIDIDHPRAEPDPESRQVSTENRVPSPEPAAPQTSLLGQPGLATEASDNEWSSPAFIKRARTSYGSLFDTDYDPFEEEDGTVPGKGRKRVKSSRLSRKWRYTSRTPSPEVDEPEEEPNGIVSPEPTTVVPTTPAMTDEASQTISLENGNAVDTSTRTSGQYASTAVQVDTGDTDMPLVDDKTSTETRQDGITALTDSSDVGILHPVIPILQEPNKVLSQQELLQIDVAQAEFDETVAAPQPPLSPRLEPQSSDGLPLVSPLVEFKVGPFGAPPPVAPPGFDQSWDDQLNSSANVQEVSMANAHKNIYDVTPTISAAEQPSFGFENFREAAIDLNNMGTLHFEEQPNPEHQYGQWQSVNDVASRSISPYKMVGEIGENYAQQVYDEAHSQDNVIEGQFFGTVDISTTQLTHPEQYPDVSEAQLEGLGRSPDTRSGPVEYPALPSPKDNFNHPISQDARPSTQGSGHISRPQSQQSGPVDLTEDSDEVDEDDDRDTENSFEEDIVKQDGDGLQNRQRSIRGVRQVQEDHDEQLREDEEYDRDALASNIDDEEEYDEEEEYKKLPTGYRPNAEEEYEEDYDRPLGYEQDDDNGFDGEEPEDSYDEDEDDEDEDEEEEDFEVEPAAPPVNREPVFIDLLSSDEEDEPENTAARGPVQKPIPKIETHEEEYSEDEDSDIDESPHARPHTQDARPAKNIEELLEKSYQEYDDGNPPPENIGTGDDDSDEVDSVESIESNDDDEDVEMAQSAARDRENEEVESVKSIEDDQDVVMGQPQSPSGKMEEVESAELIEEDEDDEMAEVQSESGDKDGDIAATLDQEQQLEHKEDGPENITQEFNMGINNGEQVNNVDGTETFEPRPTSSDEKELPLVAENELRQISDIIITKTESEISNKNRGESESFQNEDTGKSGDVDMSEEPGSSLNKDPNLIVLEETVHTGYNKDLEIQPTQILPDDETSQEFGGSHPTQKEGQVEESRELSQVPAEVSDQTSATKEIHTLQNSESVSLGMVQVPQDILNSILKDQLSKAAVAATEQPGFSPENVAQETDNLLSTNESRPTPSRQFSLDGAVDNYPREVVYPILPVDETTQLTMTGLEQPDEDMSPADEFSKQENAQLPTPDETQATQTVIMEETSFTSNANVELVGGNVDDSLEHITGIVSDAVKVTTEGEDILAGESGTDTAIAQVQITIDEANIDDAIQQAIREEQGDDEEILEPNIEDFIYREEPPADHDEQAKESVEPDGADALPATPVTPVRRSSRNARTATPGSTRSNLSIILDDRPKVKGHDPSVELAMSALSSPLKPDSDLHRSNDTPLKLKSTKALRTEFSEFTSLKLLRFNINKKLDILAIVTTSTPEPQRAKGGPRHYQITFNVTDATIGPSHVLEVQVFRPYKDALPIVKSGDGILLRNFQVISVKGGFALRSDQTESSSWAVFKGKDNEVEVRGPPVEHGAGEKEHIVSLKAWYEGLDDISRTKIDRANGEKGGNIGVRTRAKAAL